MHTARSGPPPGEAVGARRQRLHDRTPHPSSARSPRGPLAEGLGDLLAPRPALDELPEGALRGEVLSLGPRFGTLKAPFTASFTVSVRPRRTRGPSESTAQSGGSAREGPLRLRAPPREWGRRPSDRCASRGSRVAAETATGQWQWRASASRRHCHCPAGSPSRHPRPAGRGGGDALSQTAAPPPWGGGGPSFSPLHVYPWGDAFGGRRPRPRRRRAPPWATPARPRGPRTGAEGAGAAKAAARRFPLALDTA